MRFTNHTWFGLSCVCLGAACDAQATPEYLGESLLSLVGSVTIEDDRTRGKLVPALAFENFHDGRVDIMDVESRGEFPSNFQLDVHTPPPEASLTHGPPNESRYALGYITAVTVDHEPSIHFSPGQAGSRYCDDESCYEDFKACTVDGSRCYRETRRCDLSNENCLVTEMSGDPSILEDPFSSFAGLSANYRVLYLDSPARRGSWLANIFGGGTRLKAGYHLLSVRPKTTSEQQALAECYARAHDDVLAAYNEEHGTNFEDINDLSYGCPDDGPRCDSLDSEGFSDLIEHFDERSRELGCRDGDDVYTRIKDPTETRISIRIGPDVGPLAGRFPGSG